MKKGPTSHWTSGPWYYCRQRPTLPHSFPCSTIGGIRLNFRVRNGNGCDPDPMTTGMLAAWGPAVARCRELWWASFAACPPQRRKARRWVVPDNLLIRTGRIAFKERMLQLITSKLQLTSEYPANGSFDRVTRARSVSSCIKRNIWSSLTAD